jgi:integron integrase
MQPPVRNSSQGAIVIPLVRPNLGQEAGNPARPPRLLDQVRESLRARHYSARTEQAYLGWIRRFILFHGKRHPDTMGEAEIGAYLSSLASEAKVSASTQNQALAALLYLYQQVLGRELDWLGNLVHAKRPVRVPVVLGREEVRSLLARLDGTPWLVCALLYGGGLRLLEALQLRVKDIDLERREITVCRGKGQKDRRTVLPAVLVERLRSHLTAVRARHDLDISLGAGAVALPDALARKYPNAAREWIWQWVFPASRTYTHPVSRQIRRHHLHESVIQPAVREAAAAARISKRISPHTLPQLRDPLAGGRVRHSHHPRAAGSQRRPYDHDLHARAQPGRSGRAQSPRHVRRTGASKREVARWLQPALQPNPGFPVPIGGNCWNSREISALLLGR